jgi:uncharacterized protein YqjF (DUF2071 family)
METLKAHFGASFFVSRPRTDGSVTWDAGTRNPLPSFKLPGSFPMSRPRSDRIFLSAQWRNLVMLNWQIEPSLLSDHVPAGTELDFFEGRTFVSIVGFQFLQTSLLGIPIPFHRNFEELNLRIYVRREESEEIKRGVAFISEIVPKWAIAATARQFYNENYIALKMEHRLDQDADAQTLEYRWKHADRWNRLGARSVGEPNELQTGSIEEFIAEHYWGYSEQRDRTTFEYRVRHDPWRVWQAEDIEFDCDTKALYGETFAEVLAGPPDSAFIAKGSPVTVSFPQRLT